MASVTPLQKFISLITFDSQALQLEHESQHLQQESLVLSNKLESVRCELEQLGQQIKDTQKGVDTAELNGQTLTAVEKEKRQLLEKIESKQEYTALKKEIATVKEALHKNELEIVSAWNKLESAKHNFNKQREAVDLQIIDLKKQLQDKSQRLTIVKQELAQQEKLRQSKIQDIPNEWLNKYSNMRARVNNPAVPVINGVCSACFYDITGTDLAKLKNQSLQECHGCFRFLYLPEIDQK